MYLYFCLNFSAASLTLCNDDKSKCNVSHNTFSLSCFIFSTASVPFFRSLQAIITVQPCRANDLAVSNP